MTRTRHLSRAAVYLAKAGDAEDSQWRCNFIVEAIKHLESTGDRDLSPIIARLSEASLNVSDNDCLVEIGDALSEMAREPVTMGRAA